MNNILTSNGVVMDTSPEKMGPLRKANDLLGNLPALRAQMKEDGYLYFKKFIDPVEVLRAREEILLKYAIIGEIDSINHPIMDAVHSKNSFINQVNLIAFDESVRKGMAYESLVHHQNLKKFFSEFFGNVDVCTFDFKWVRFLRPGEGCGFHSDSVYVCRATRNLYSCWIPIGNVSMQEGALIVLENSHKNEALKNSYGMKDADHDKLGWLSTDPIGLQNRLGGRWLSTDFEAGDIIIFDVYLVHGTLDNNSPVEKCRLTTDIRYQPASEPLDDRWNGEQFKAGGIVNPHGEGAKVFIAGLDRGQNNVNFTEEWKSVDEYGRLLY